MLTGTGNGRLDAVSNALKEGLKIDYTITTYSENATELGSKSKAMCMIGITTTDGKVFWGAGVDTDIINASIYALVSAINNAEILG